MVRLGEFRILFLGDSITWGDYLPREEVYVERLEARLNGASRGTRYQVINAGMGDLGMAEEVGVLRELGLKTDPDLVGVGFYLNDSRAPWGAYVEKGALYRLLRRSRFLNWVYRLVWVQAYVMKHGKERFPRIDLYESGRWRHDEASYRELVESAGNDWGAGWDQRSWRIIDWQLDRLLDLEKKHGFRLFLVCFPVRVQVESSIFDDTPQRALLGVLPEEGDPVPGSHARAEGPEGAGSLLRPLPPEAYGKHHRRERDPRLPRKGGAAATLSRVTSRFLASRESRTRRWSSRPARRERAGPASPSRASRASPPPACCR